MPHCHARGPHTAALTRQHAQAAINEDEPGPPAWPPADEQTSEPGSPGSRLEDLPAGAAFQQVGCACHAGRVQQPWCWGQQACCFQAMEQRAASRAAQHERASPPERSHARQPQQVGQAGVPGSLACRAHWLLPAPLSASLQPSLPLCTGLCKLLQQLLSRAWLQDAPQHFSGPGLPSTAPFKPTSPSQAAPGPLRPQPSQLGVLGSQSSRLAASEAGSHFGDPHLLSDADGADPSGQPGATQQQKPGTPAPKHGGGAASHVRAEAGPLQPLTPAQVALRSAVADRRSGRGRQLQCQRHAGPAVPQPVPPELLHPHQQHQQRLRHPNEQLHPCLRQYQRQQLRPAATPAMGSAQRWPVQPARDQPAEPFAKPQEADDMSLPGASSMPGTPAALVQLAT